METEEKTCEFCGGNSTTYDKCDRSCEIYITGKWN